MPGALVPYGGTVAYRAGYNLGRAYGPVAAKWAARRIGRAAMGYLRRRRYKRRGVYKQIRSVRRRMEKPYKRNANTLTISGTTGELNEAQVGESIQQGTSVDQRSAQSICIRGIQINLSMMNTDGNNDIIVRVMLLKLKSGNSVTSFADLQTGLWKLENQTEPLNFISTGFGANSTQQATNFTLNKKKWAVMWQKRIKLLRDNQNSQGRQYYRRNHLLKLRKEINLYYRNEGAASNQYDQIRPQIHLLWFAEHLNTNAVAVSSVDYTACGHVTYFCKNS